MSPPPSKCLLLALFLALTLASSSPPKLRVNTYTKLPAYMLYSYGTWSGSTTLIGGSGSTLGLYATIDVNEASVIAATNVEKGEIGPSASAAFDGSDAAYTSIYNVSSNDSQVVMLDSNLDIQHTLTVEVDGDEFLRGFGCQYSEIVDGLWTCIAATEVYQYNVSDEGEFTFNRTFTIDFSGSTNGLYTGPLGVQKWIKSSSGEYIAYGNTSSSGLFILSVASDFSTVTAGWAFGALTLRLAEDIAEVEGIAGLFALTGTVKGSDDGFVAYFDLLTATTVDNYNFLTFAATSSTTISVASAGGNNFVMTTQDTITYFERASNDTYSNSWSKKLSSSLGQCNVQEVFTQSNGNLLLMTLLPEEAGESLQDGPLQLAEMTQKGEVAGKQTELTTADSTLTFSQIQYWPRGGGPAPIKDQVTMTETFGNPWRSATPSANPTQEELSVTPTDSINNLPETTF